MEFDSEQLKALIADVVNTALMASKTSSDSAREGFGSVQMETPQELYREIISDGIDSQEIITLQDGESGGSGGAGDSGCYVIVKNEITNQYSFENRYIMAGGKVITGPNYTFGTEVCGKIIALKLTNDYTTLYVDTYDSIGDIQQAVSDDDMTIYPLYKFDTNDDPDSTDVSVIIDFRNMPIFDTWAFYGSYS